ncbi:sensor domain-containing protein [Mycobacterium sp. ITM-2016-00318]|uniref:sensor domain-containing protein n=1 Tax=Mycobacterium sp. ITM-2016-00318 TaxID=2099693 RepID=UPI000CF8E0D0|nr:sensor domain-containing protein [Mycobacterium sp. ITM-2016-00318]WNG94641.1 sensor domain-containing protein [Mycobacterium sp. ITM-2016-00318]
MSSAAGRLAVLCAVALLTGGCAQTIAGTATRTAPGIDDESRSPVDVESVMLDQAQMQAITGAGDALTIVPSMDGKIPVDVSDLMTGTPQECQWYFAETQTFGNEVEEFHKTTFQNPPDGGLISEGAAAYRDQETARHAFADLVGQVYDCGSTELGSTFIGEWTADADTLTMRSPGTCGRDYRLKNVVLVEVSFCVFPDSVPGIVMTNIIDKVPD